MDLLEKCNRLVQALTTGVSKLVQKGLRPLGDIKIQSMLIDLYMEQFSSANTSSDLDMIARSTSIPS
jgi:hypothetical protein